MRFECSNCGQSTDADNALLGKAMECPNCHESVIVPPPIHTALQPVALSDPGFINAELLGAERF
jgi:hypothetical protein